VRWLADECVDAGLVGQLRAAGHDVRYIAEDASGSRLAEAEARLVLTEDKDVGELVFRARLAVPGVVLLRIDPEQRAIKWERLEVAITRYGDGLFGRYVVVQASRLRSRPLLRPLD